MAEMQTESNRPLESTTTSSTETKAVPVKPTPLICTGGCGALIDATWIEEAKLFDKVIKGTGVWDFQSEMCQACSDRIGKLHHQEANAGKVKKFLAEAGFKKIHEPMAMEKLDGPGAAAIQGSVPGFLQGYIRGLYLFGKPGVGKTFPAVALLKKVMQEHAVPGRFEIVPELVSEMRAALREKKAEAIMREISNTDALLLDDMGVERPTPYVIECLYMLVDRWYRDNKPWIIITSNRSPNEIGQTLDDRIASRITHMCRVIEITGPDRRAVKN